MKTIVINYTQIKNTFKMKIINSLHFIICLLFVKKINIICETFIYTVGIL